jgi:hypothetical protein
VGFLISKGGFDPAEMWAWLPFLIRRNNGLGTIICSYRWGFTGLDRGIQSLVRQ